MSFLWYEILQQMGIYINRCFEMTWNLYYKFVTRLLYTFCSVYTLFKVYTYKCIKYIHWDSICVYILYRLSLSIYLYYFLMAQRNYFSKTYIIITKSASWCVWCMIVYVLLTHLGASTYDVVHWGNVPKRYTASCYPWWPWHFYQFTAYFTIWSGLILCL